jgi:oxalate decarboxylase/phosphoglucose isomerase-like protein (cupin superfamily)
MIKKIPIDPTYRKDNGLWNLETPTLPFPNDFQVKERNVVYIPAGEFGGNHKHPRAEAFVGIGEELYMVWKDENGEKHEDKMMDGNQLYFFYVEPFTPHAVINKSSGFAVLVEFANGPNVRVERADVLGGR